MIFGKKTVIVSYTVQTCDSCGHTAQTKFKNGDYVLATGTCGKCGEVSVVRGIFGQEEELP